VIIVQTTRREGVSYLADTLRSLNYVGSRRKIILSDGPLAEDFARPDDWAVVELPWRGARAAGWSCMDLALSLQAVDLLLMQDDVIACDGGGSTMDRAPVPDNCIATTFYSCQSLPGLQPKALGDPRLIVIGASGTAQALKLPRRSLEYLCARNFHVAPNLQDEPHLFDDALFSFGRQSPWPHVAHLVPNVVRHVGAVSACGTRRPFNQPWAVTGGGEFPADVTKLIVHEVTYAGAGR
jgi:hypothetical protein